MVKSVTSLTGSGLKDWLIQRVSAVYLALYLIGLFAYIGCHQPMTFDVWHAFFQTTVVQILTALAIFMFVLHAWIGIWTVTTDYIQSTVVRLSVQVLVALFLSTQLIWGFMIVWGQ